MRTYSRPRTTRSIPLRPFLLSLFVLSLPGAVPSAFAVAQTEADIRSRLTDAATSTLASQDIRLDESAARLLASFIHAGAKTLAASDEDRFAESVQNITQFASALATTARAGQGKTGTVTASVFEQVKKRFCPLYPFC